MSAPESDDVLLARAARLWTRGEAERQAESVNPFASPEEMTAAVRAFHAARKARDAAHAALAAAETRVWEAYDEMQEAIGCTGVEVPHVGAPR